MGEDTKLMVLGPDLGQHSRVRTLGRPGFQNPVMRLPWAAQIQSWQLCVSTKSGAGGGLHPCYLPELGALEGAVLRAPQCQVSC